MKRWIGIFTALALSLSLSRAAGDAGFAEWLRKDTEARQQFRGRQTQTAKPAEAVKEPETRAPETTPPAPAPEAAPSRSAARAPQRSAEPGWLVMVYMAADNNLDPYALEDVVEMQKIGSSDHLKITVLMDRVDYGEWSEARRFLVRRPEDQGGKPSWDLSLPTCVSAGEPNMGDPQTLTDFVRWSLETFPQPNTMLVLWNHGGGWRSTPGATPVRKLHPLRAARQANARGIAWDDTAGGDFLEMREVRAALEEFPSLTVIGADACLMGMLEVAYELRDQAAYFIGSQDLEPGDGWPYDRWLPALAENPALDPETLCRKIVGTYTESYGARPTTLSAVRLAAIPALAKAVDAVACGVIEHLEKPGGVPVSFQGLPWFAPKSPEFVDLGAFLERLRKTMPPPLAELAETARKALEAALTVNASHPSLGGTGLCIYPGGGPDDADYRPGIIQFARDTRWDEMLREMGYHQRQTARAVIEAGDPSRWAVLIGVSQYTDAAVPSLRYAVADVAALRTALIERAGYREENIFVLTNAMATAESVRSTLGTWLPRQVSDRDMVMIYFSGHGGAEPSLRGNAEDGTEKYMMLADSKLDDMYSTALPMSELSRIFGRIRAEKLLFVMDSCYAGAAGDGGKGVLREGMKAIGLSDDYLGALTGSKGTVVLTASRASEVSMESPEFGMGVFTHYLCEALRGGGDSDGDGMVSVMELYQHLSRHVPAAAKKMGASQHPVLKGEISGTFPIAIVKQAAQKGSE